MEGDQRKSGHKKKSRSTSESREKRIKKKKRKRRRDSSNPESSTDSAYNDSSASLSSSSLSSGPSPPPKRRKKSKDKKGKLKKKMHSEKKRSKHKHKDKAPEKHRKKRHRESVTAEKRTPGSSSTMGLQPTPSAPTAKNEAEIKADLKALVAAQNTKAVQGPMTKEDYERQQSIVRRVYDPDTGRHRLVKGDGEIIEEIVSRERQKAINKQATLGDGLSFQAEMKKLL